MNSNRPAPTEFAPYFKKYVILVQSEDILSELKKEDLQSFMSGLSNDQWTYAYAPGKWTVKESMLHIIDTERVFAYRALRTARGDETPLPGFDQDHFAKYASANKRSPESLSDEFDKVRAASCSLYGSLSEEAWGRHTEAGGHICTARALAYMTMGHQIHHINLFREKYKLG